MNNINYAFKPEEISEIKPYYDQALNSNTINLDMQTTDLSSSHMKKHRKKYDNNIQTLESNNLNYDYEEKDQNNFNHLLTNSLTSNPKTDFFDQSSILKENNNHNIIIINEKPKDKLDELINQFNNLYTIDGNNNSNLRYDKHSNNLSYDKVNNNNINNEINIHQKKNFDNKSIDNLKFNNKRNKNQKKIDELSNNQYHINKVKNTNKAKSNIFYNANATKKSRSNNHVLKTDKSMRNDNIYKTCDNESNISLKANKVINEFKKTLIEAEKIENELNKTKISINAYDINETNDIFNINHNLNMDLNRIKNDINNNINDEDEFIETEDEVEKLKIKNEILLKSNNLLKNENKILLYEISLYKNNPIYNNKNDLNNLNNINSFIEELKQNLQSSIKNNQYYENIINKTQNEYMKIKEEKNQLNIKFNLIKDECDKLTNENSQLKVNLENINKEANLKEKYLDEKNKEISNLNIIINENKNKIKYLNDMQISNKISQKDNEDLFSELKDTIENLQKINIESNNNILELKNKLNDTKISLDSKNDIISNLNQKIKNDNLSLKAKESQLNELNKIIQDSNNKNINIKNDLNNALIEKEKLNNEIKNLKLLISNKDNTISELKNSISFIFKIFNQNMSKINYNINNAFMKEENDTLDLNKNLKILTQKMQEEIFNLNQKNNEEKNDKKKLEKEIDEYNELYDKMKNEYQILYQKYLEQNRTIENMKNEFLIKNKNKENEVQKINEEKFDLLMKLKKSQNENNILKNQVQHFKKNYEIINSELVELTNNNFNSKIKNNNNESQDIHSVKSDNINLINDIKDENMIPNIDTDINYMENLKYRDLMQFSDEKNFDKFNIKNKDENLDYLFEKYEDKKDINSTQLNLNKINSYNDINDIYNNEYQTFPISFNHKIKNINLNVKDKIDKNIYNNIYNLKEGKIIGFNLIKKKFILINPIDKTESIYSSLISKNSFQPLTLNCPYGFFILISNFIFYYDETNNTIDILTKLISSHNNGCFISINQELYSISGKNCLECEKHSLKMNQNIKLPKVNYERVNSSLCNVNDEYLYILFGDKCGDSIERLNLKIEKEKSGGWEGIKIYDLVDKKGGENLNLKNFCTFLDDYNNIIILGGCDDKDNNNEDIYCFNFANNEINIIGKIDTCALYLGQNIQLSNAIIAIYDANNGLHFFNKELDYHEIYNFNL